MSRYLTLDGLIGRLEEGEEICGICGNDVTGKPDCVHNNTSIAHSTSTSSTPQHRSPRSLQCKPTSMRIGMEMLMYPDDLLALPCLDKEFLFRVWGREVMSL